MSDEWTFTFTKDKMEDADLAVYQKKLLDLRDKYANFVSKIPECLFYTGDLPPKNNIFAQFRYKCQQHEPRCTGWCLYWNPNLVEDKHLLNGVHHNSCAPTRYKVWSKQIQADLELTCFEYFKLFHEGGNTDYYKLSDNFYLSFLPDEEEIDQIQLEPTKYEQ